MANHQRGSSINQNAIPVVASSSITTATTTVGAATADNLSDTSDSSSHFVDSSDSYSEEVVCSLLQDNIDYDILQQKSNRSSVVASGVNFKRHNIKSLQDNCAANVKSHKSTPRNERVVIKATSSNNNLNNREENCRLSLKEEDTSSMNSRTFDIDSDDLSELSDLELNFDAPVEWPDGDLISNHPELANHPLQPGVPLHLDNQAAKLILYQGDKPDLKSVDPRTQARLEALLEAAGIGKLSTTDGKAFRDPEVLRKLTSSVSCALDEAAASLTRMRAENQTSELQSSRTLAEACTDGDIEAVKRLLDEGRSVHETNEEGESLLSLACSAGYYELAEVLLRMRANVEDRGRKGDCTPLMEAASSGYPDITKLLISYRADVNAQSSAGHTALHHAAVGGFETVVQMLINAGANVEQQNENGHTPLMESASAGHVGVAKILLNADAGINTHSNEFKESALTLACYKGHLDMVKFLLDAGADQEHKTDEMHTALMEASMDGHVEVARLLLDSGAQVNMPIDSFESPLTLAACGGHVELAGLLLERGAKMEEVNDEGYTALMEASREGHEDMVSLLLTNGAQVNTQTDETQETALTLACCGGFIEVASALINNNADIELGCSTPLMEASQEGHLDLVNFLISKGSDVHALTATSDTALTYACENGHTDVADVLLNAGANLENESEGGRTPLMKAARAGHLCTVQFLLSKGAGVNRCTTNNEHTVLSLACAGGHLGVVELLLEHGADPMHKLKDGSTMLIEAAKGGHTNVVNLLLDYPNGSHKSAAVSSEYPDSIPMADDLPADPSNPKDLSLKSTESLASRLEQFIHKMMSQADNSSGTREEQMARKQEILEELQRVEQELKLRTQIAQQESARPPDGQAGLPSLSPFPANMTPSHEFVEQELQQKQMAIAEQQRHEAQLQQQKEYYQAKLQHLKQQYQEKQLQLQHQRQQLLSQAAANNSPSVPQEPNDESSKRQPVPLHIALQNHLYAHHVTEGNVDDLALALQEWDTRDRNINLPSTLVKPMPAFNLSTKADSEEAAEAEQAVAELPLRMEDLSFNEAPPSRSLAHSLATLIQGMDYNNKSSNFDSTLERAIASTSGLGRPANEYDMTLKTMEWLKLVDESCGADSPTEPKNGPLTTGQVNKPIVKGDCESMEKHGSTTKITKVLNGYIEPSPASTDSLPPAAGQPTGLVPTPQRSTSPSRLPHVDPNAATDSNHDTALTLACAGGHTELVKLLLSRSAEIEHRDKKGFTPLILASTAGHHEVVEILIEHGAEVEAQSERTKDTPLSLACSGGRYEVVEILLRLGANKEHRNVSDYTPLSLAASGGYVNIIKLLLSYAAEINSRTGSKLGISPLMLAAMNGHTAAVKLLLDMGSDINAQIETNRNTALTLACFQGRHDVVSLLVDRKANIEHRAKTGLTPLMEAASGGYVEVGRVLLDRSADVNAPPVPSSKDTALTIAADKGHYRFVDLLLKRGAAVDVKNKKGNSPLWLACNGGHLDVVQLLVAHKADIDSQDNRRVSSLMTAFRKGHIKVVKWLVKHVSQFPSDQECGRFIATVSDKELLKKCQQCMEIIVQAKEQQAREALKNASILLEQIESEKSREERRREAAARKREKKKQKRKEKQAENHMEKVSPEIELTKSDRSSTPEQAASISVTLSEPADTDTSPVGEQSMQQKIQANKGCLSNEGKETDNIERKEENMTDIIGKENVSNKRNRRNKEKTGNRNDPPNTAKKTTNKDITKQTSSSSRITELDDFADALSVPNGSKSRHSKRAASSVSQLDSFECTYSSKSPLKSTPTKAGVSPSPGKKKREEGGSDWKQVTNKKTKKVAVPSRCVNQLSKSLHSIKDKSGAHLEFEKVDKKSGDRTLIIRGSAEAIRNGQSLVSGILREPHAEASAQLSKKSSITTSIGNTASLSQANVRDTLSNVGTFKISDYIATTQAAPIVDTKVKVVQSKPGWPVRPPPAVSQSAWGAPSGDHLVACHVPTTAVNKAPQIRMPSSQSSGVKMLNDVSRQLFPESRATVSPSLATSDSKQRVTSSTAEQLDSQHSANHSPVSNQLPPPAQLNTQSGFGGSHYMTGPNNAPLLAKVPISVSAGQLAHPPYMFENQPLTGASNLASGYLPNLGHADIHRNLPHPNKAPGFRSTPPQALYFSDPNAFSRAPGTRANPMFTNDHAMPVQNSSLADMEGDSGQMVGPGVGMPFSDSRKSSPLLQRDQYTTRGQPMTLPHITSSLNPNASEFNAPQRFSASNGPQVSPRTSQQHEQMGSPVDMRPVTPGYPSQNRSKPANEQDYGRKLLTGNQTPTVSPSIHTGQKASGAVSQQSVLSASQAFTSTGSLLLVTTEAPAGQNHSSASPPEDQSDRTSVGPIGSERYLFNHNSDIWSSSNKGKDTEWSMNVPIATPQTQTPVPPPVSEPLFKPEEPIASQFQFYNSGGLNVGAGDGIHTSWNGSPGKGSQLWPQWDQSNSQ